MFSVFIFTCFFCWELASWGWEALDSGQKEKARRLAGERSVAGGRRGEMERVSSHWASHGPRKLNMCKTEAAHPQSYLLFCPSSVVGVTRLHVGLLRTIILFSFQASPYLPQLYLLNSSQIHSLFPIPAATNPGYTTITSCLDYPMKS